VHRWIGRASVYRCELSFGSWVCRRVVFTRSAARRPRVRSTISRPVRIRRPHHWRAPRSRRSGTWSRRPSTVHVATGPLAILAQRLGTVSASPSTWYRLVPKHRWRRLGLHVHPEKLKIGLWPNARWRRRARSPSSTRQRSGPRRRARSDRRRDERLRSRSQR
jgi:hypothetical protein